MSDAITYIEPSMLDNLSQFLSADKLQSLLQRYLEDSTRLLEQLNEALAAGNAEDARRHVHSLKSTSANLGAVPVSKLAAQLEQLALDGQLDAVQSHVVELSELFANTAEAIQSLTLMQQTG